MSKYIQSFYQYPVTFSCIGKTVPARSAQGEMKNIAEVSDKEYDRLMNAEPRFRELVSQKKYRVLNHIPASYVPPAEQVNNANEEANKLRSENEALKARLAELEKATKTESEESNEEVVETESGETGSDEVAEEEVKTTKKTGKKRK